MTRRDPERDFIRLKEDWLTAIIADDALPPRAVAVAATLARHINRASGHAWPSMQSMVSMVGGAGERTIRYALAALEERGYLVAREKPAARQAACIEAGSAR